MAITHTWDVVKLDVYPSRNGRTDVVGAIHWRVGGGEGGATAAANGSVDLKFDAAAPFTPYPDLTKAQVIGWLKAALGPMQTAAIEDYVTQQVAEQLNPPVTHPPLPW